MSTKEIKTLLSERGISSKGCLEKEDLVARAKKALADGVPKKAPVAKSVKEEKSQKKPASKVDKPKPTLSRSRLMMCFAAAMVSTFTRRLTALAALVDCFCIL